MEIKKLLQCMKNPIKSQIVLSLYQHPVLTPQELLELNDSISQATLYRTLKKMEEEEILEVASKTQKRGAIEKSYKLAESMLNFGNSVISLNDGDAYAKMFSDFVTELLVEFDNYSKQEPINIAEDGSGFSAVPIYATTDELAVYGKEIKKILEPAFKRTNPEQDLHTFATIITPPGKEKK
ncbi:helix-turn-helix domain-containing protein [Jeotgalibaca ciconiae]|nr:helix-turn-helix transcriptional regulator [Jeotgalibaca ciconiae]